MILHGLTVSHTKLSEIVATEFEGRQAAVHPRLKRIKQHDIVATGLRYPSCKCEEIGLHEGMTVDALMHLSAGCCTRWVCPRLSALRRIYGY